MNKLHDIKLTKEGYEYLFNFNTPYFGAESILIPDEGNGIIKLFKDKYGKFSENPEGFELVKENKFNKLCKIASLKNFDNEILPLCTYSYRGNFVGYLMPRITYPLLDSYCLSTTQKIECLKLIKEKLDLFHEYGIIYGDIKEDNIFYDVKRGLITFGDIDNVQIDIYYFDIMHYFVKNFIRKTGNVNEKVDSYVMNLLTIDFLNPTPKWYHGILENINYLSLPEVISTDRNYRLIKEMAHITPSYSGKYLIDDTNNL